MYKHLDSEHHFSELNLLSNVALLSLNSLYEVIGKIKEIYENASTQVGFLFFFRPKTPFPTILATSNIFSTRNTKQPGVIANAERRQQKATTGRNWGKRRVAGGPLIILKCLVHKNYYTHSFSMRFIFFYTSPLYFLSKRAKNRQKWLKMIENYRYKTHKRCKMHI